MATYKTVTYEDRKKIEKMYKSGMSMTKIAEAIGKNYSTVYRELVLNRKGCAVWAKMQLALPSMTQMTGFTGRL